MHYISVCVLALAVFFLVACSAMLKDKEEIEKVAEDVIEEIAEDMIEI